MVSDILAGVEFMKKRSDVDLKRIGILGSSQGGWIGSMTAAKSKDVSLLIVVCSSGVPIYENVVREIEGTIRPMDFPEPEVKQALSYVLKLGKMASDGESYFSWRTVCV